MAPGTDTWSFHCSACGKCCNSPPQMSVLELFHHQRRFIGCLAIRRIPRLRAGDPLGDGVPRGIATEADARAQALLADALLHQLSGRAGTGDVSLATQAFDAPGSGEPSTCPALGPDMRCAIHHDRKPAACVVVPLDALLADRLQHVVLGERRVEASYLGADCIVPGVRPGAAPVTRRLSVVDPVASEALAQRRRDLLADKRMWGEAVFDMLRGELFDDVEALARIPERGSLVMSIAPVLMVLAAASARSRDRCLEYLDAQIELIERSIPRGASRGPAAATEPRAQLGPFLRTSQALMGALRRAPARPASGRAKDVEAWMGIGCAT